MPGHIHRLRIKPLAFGRFIRNSWCSVPSSARRRRSESGPRSELKGLPYAWRKAAMSSADGPRPVAGAGVGPRRRGAVEGAGGSATAGAAVVPTGGPPPLESAAAGAAAAAAGAAAGAAA